MVEEIYMNDLECPHCDRDTYCESWVVEVDPDSDRVTEVMCDKCGKNFYVHTKLIVEIKNTR